MSTSPKELTGRKVLLITLLAFGTVIGANLTLVFTSIGSFPGTEVKNTYVASQTFDAEREAQAALGWTAQAVLSDGTLTLSILGEDGLPAIVKSIDATVGKATTAVDDRPLDLSLSNGSYVMPLSLPEANWQVRFTAIAPDGTVFKQRLSLFVKG